MVKILAEKNSENFKVMPMSANKLSHDNAMTSYPTNHSSYSCILLCL